MWQKLLIGFSLLSGLFLLWKTTNLKRIQIQNSLLWYFSKYRELKPYVSAMAKYESGNYTNTLAKEYYNVFSMTMPRSRPEISIGATGETSLIDNQVNQWQIYNSYTMALKDLFLYFDFMDFPDKVNSVDLFVRELKDRGYFTAPYYQYLNGVKNYI